MNKLTVTLLVALLVCTGAKLSDPAAKAHKQIITHFNITFAPDLSNRIKPSLYPRPLTDVNILDILVSDLYPFILNAGNRFEGQKDKFQIDFINKALITQYHVKPDLLVFDFGTFPNQGKRIDYILDRTHPQKTFKKDSIKILSEFSRINRLAVQQNFGADIWSYMQSGIDEKKVLGPEKQYSDDDDNTYQDSYRNVLILTTDGYIEAGIFGKGYDLSQKRINSFRKAFETSGETNLQNFFQKHKEYRINPIHNPNLKNLEVLVMELFDRSLSKGGTASVHPTDMEIIKLFWAEWLKQSGVKHFALQACAGSRNEAEKTILNFLEVRK